MSPINPHNNLIAGVNTPHIASQAIEPDGGYFDVEDTEGFEYPLTKEGYPASPEEAANDEDTIDYQAANHAHTLAAAEFDHHAGD